MKTPPQLSLRQAPPDTSGNGWNRPVRIWEVAIVLLLAAALSGLTKPMPHHGKKANQSEAVGNARQIGLALVEFESIYGNFPSEETAAKIREENPNELELGSKFSNDFFRQLIATGLVQSETQFYADVKGVRKPDNVMGKGEALKKGECGFAYLSSLALDGNPRRPLVVTPLIPGTDRFDPERFDGKAYILHIDSSASSYTIHKGTGHVMAGGKNLLDPDHPIWEGRPPVIKWQE